MKSQRECAEFQLGQKPMKMAVGDLGGSISIVSVMGPGVACMWNLQATMTYVDDLCSLWARPGER